MAFEFWSEVTHGGAKATTDILALVALRVSSSILSRLASVGDLSYMFETLVGAAMGVLGALGVIRCFGRNALCPSPALVDEQNNPTKSERQRPVQEPSEQDPEVTIRLEDGHLWLLRSHRCIVTVRTSIATAQNAGQESWYAQDEK